MSNFIDGQPFDIYEGHREIAARLWHIVQTGDDKDRIKAAKVYLKYLKFTDALDDQYFAGVASERSRTMEDTVAVDIKEL